LVRIGRACAFPPFQTGRATFTASGFPYSFLLFVGLCSATFYGHGTTRCVRTPTMLGNMNSLPTMFSDLQVLLDASTFLADLRPARAITARPLTTTPPPSSVLHAGILASHCWMKQLQSSPIPRGYVLAILSMPALRRVCLW
jgi:hypothetical protein